ncbi:MULTISPECIES: HAD-IA family hydrolase [unclassified Luteococcus]|uniref:HAD-IA family hydrolase n=1 Tax=unclassified Luteococcus TaxID=2639923 RepID=UPI00313AA418
MTTPPTPRPLLIDMDGTLVDSTAVVEQTWTDFCARHGLDPAEVIAYAHGRPSTDTTHHFLADPGLAQRENDRIVAHETHVTEGITAMPGAVDFIAALPRDTWALVTSANRELATNRLGVAGIPLPDACVFSEDITRGKPDPQPYLLAAERLGVEIADCVVLEDSDAGIRSGMASGATTVVVGALDRFDDQLLRIPDFHRVTPAVLFARLANR